MSLLPAWGIQRHQFGSVQTPTYYANAYIDTQGLAQMPSAIDESLMRYLTHSEIFIRVSGSVNHTALAGMVVHHSYRHSTTPSH